MANIFAKPREESRYVTEATMCRRLFYFLCNRLKPLSQFIHLRLRNRLKLLRESRILNIIRSSRQGMDNNLLNHARISDDTYAYISLTNCRLSFLLYLEILHFFLCPINVVATFVFLYRPLHLLHREMILAPVAMARSAYIYVNNRIVSQ